MLRRVALPASGLYPLATVALAVLVVRAPRRLHTSGFAAVYVASLVLGNAELPHRPTVRSFVEGLAWLAQIGLFVMLGLLAWPSRLGLSDVVAGLVAGVALTFLARPSGGGVVLPLAPFRSRMPAKEQLFVSWAGLRGAVPIVLATIPLAADLAGADRLFDVVFVLVVVFTLVQAPTLPLGRQAAPDRRRGRGTRSRHRGGAAGTDRGRPARGPDPAHAPGWPASRSVSYACRRVRRSPWWSERAAASCQLPRPCSRSATTCSS